MSKITRMTIFLLISVSCIFTVLFPISGVSMAERDSPFKIYDEIMVSAVDMDCNYYLEDHGKNKFNFEYPKLILTDDRDPLIAFVDENSDKLIFAEIADRRVKIFPSISNTNDRSHKKWPWPIVFARMNRIYLAILPGPWADKNKQIQIHVLDRDTKQLHYQTDIAFISSNRCTVGGIYPYNEKYMLVAQCNYICLRYLPLVLLGGNPTYRYNVSFILDNSKELTMQTIEQKGCHTVYNQAYDVSSSGSLHAAWVRDKHGQVGSKHDETIHYRLNKNGTKWEAPIELYSVKDTEVQRQLKHLSLANSVSSAFLLWQDVKNGIFVAEVRDGKKNDVIKISDMKKADISGEPLWFASTIRVASDNNGNVYALWAQNTGRSYQLYFRSRIHGKWMKEITISRGNGYLQLPDMKVDKAGKIHITYIKSMNADEPHGKYGCFYMKIERRKDI